MLEPTQARTNAYFGSKWRRGLYLLVGFGTRIRGSLTDPKSMSVYTLWRHPQLVPLLHSQDFVLQKLRGGAPLMTPGLARGPPFPTRATKNAIVAVASLKKPSVPLVVGICEIDVASLEQVQGAKGHAVRGEHWDGDELWAWSPGGKPGGNAPENINGWDVNDAGAKLGKDIEQLDLHDQVEDEEEGGVPLNVGFDRDKQSGSHNEEMSGESAKLYEEVGAEEKELSTKGENFADLVEQSHTLMMRRH